MNARYIIEAMLFAAGEPVSARELHGRIQAAHEADGTPETQELAALTPARIEQEIEALREEHAARGGGFFLEAVGRGWQFSTAAGAGPWVRALFDEPKAGRLSAAALETLAIIAYRQPVARAAIEGVRGVQVDAVLLKLQERGLVKATGRAELPGRPLVYETTERFLEHFGLRSIDEMPNVEELRLRLPQGVVPDQPVDGSRELALGGENPVPVVPDDGPATVASAD